MSIVQTSFSTIQHDCAPADMRVLATAPLDGIVIRGFIRDEGERTEPFIEARIKWRDDNIVGAGWVLAEDPTAFVFEPEGWLPAEAL